MTTAIPETEKGFQGAVIDAAHRFGWLVAHFDRARAFSGAFVTPVIADAAGFPDLVLVRERVVYAELKSARGRVRPEQRCWLDRLHEAGAEVYIWRPADWDQVLKVLQRRAA